MRHNTKRGAAQLLAGHSLDVAAVKTKLFAPGAEGPHQIATRIVEVITGCSGFVVTAHSVDGGPVDVLQGDEETVATFARCERESVRKLRCDQSAALIVEKDLACNSGDAGIDALGVWKEMAAGRGAAAAGGRPP